MRSAYLIVLRLTLLAFGVQLYLAGVGAFDRPHDDGSFAPHRINGMVVIPLLILLATLLAALSRVPGRLIGLTILPLGVVMVQVLIGVVARAFDTGTGESTVTSVVIFGLHALNGMVVAMTVHTALQRAEAYFATRSDRVGTTEPVRL